MPYTKRHDRAAVRRLIPLLTGTLVLAGTLAPARAETADTPGYAAGTYVVKLADQPVATYQGGLKDLKRTAPAPGDRLRTGTNTVRAYLRHLDSRRDEVLDEVPGIQKLYKYDYTFNGFAAKLTARQAMELAATPGVISLTRDKAERLTPALDNDSSSGGAGRNTTTAEGAAEAELPTPDIPHFLGLDGDKGLWSKLGGPAHAGEGMIIGVVDLGIDPTNPMLAPLSEPRPDADLIAKKWHGSCDEGDDPAHKVTCNNKLIGAQWFRKGVPDPTAQDVPSPTDINSHGTHTATTAAGNHDTPAEVPGLGVRGKVSGIAPAARVAAYKACWHDGCWTSDTTAAVDKAVADGVDVISYSIGGALTTSTSMEAMFNAAKAGVFVSAGAGNSGPGTVGNTAPWITTVAGETDDTGYTSNLVLGDGRRFRHDKLQAAVPTAPLVDAGEVRKPDADAAQAALCTPGTLDPGKVKGKIVVCDRDDDQFIPYQIKEVKTAGGVAVTLANTATSTQDFSYYIYGLPMIQLTRADAKTVKEYAAGSGATGELASGTAPVRAPQVTASSSGGPDPYSGGDLLKPDIAAPGRLVLAGTVPGGALGYPDRFGFMSGTSMATPHISGLAALLKQLHPDWSPMEVKSALMTTATTTDNEGKPIGRENADPATPLDYGAGSPRAALAADPGLVYDSTSADWTSYLCGLGLRPTATDGGACATARPADPSDLNHPSIAVGDLAERQTVTRTVTNVGTDIATYEATLRTPPGYKAEVTPKRLTVPPGRSATYRVTFTRTDAAYGAWSYGSLTWSDAHSRHRVSSPITLRAARFAAPDEVTLAGERSTQLAVRAGWSGELTARAELYKAEKITGTLTGEDQSGSPAPTGDAAAKIPLHVPEGAPFTRVAVDPADQLPGSVVYVNAVDQNGVSFTAGPDNGAEFVDLPPGDYDVYVVQYNAPNGTGSQPYTLLLWKVGQTTPAVRPTVTPAAQPVTPGAPLGLTVAWPDAVPGERYVGIVEYGDGSQDLGRTRLAVTP
ncbi:S8 family peptidase [Streptomyces sp. NPDC050704]|uniref:S8 family peptidase n=1 Tax=Streptomyces sp. NPDC050704 TaxID=3157219 RepID=UPI0034336E5E